jgi:hypothetical protein
MRTGFCNLGQVDVLESRETRGVRSFAREERAHEAWIQEEARRPVALREIVDDSGDVAFDTKLPDALASRALDLCQRLEQSAGAARKGQGLNEADISTFTEICAFLRKLSADPDTDTNLDDVQPYPEPAMESRDRRPSRLKSFVATEGPQLVVSGPSRKGTIASIIE